MSDLGSIWAQMDGLAWLALLLAPLLLAQRWLHREIQYLFLLLTRRPAFSLGLFSLLLFPGVVLHELSHYLMARLTGVKTGRVSLLPGVMPGGKLRLGYVETYGADVVRDSLIGVAPLLAGGLAVAYLGLYRLGLAPLLPLLAAGDADSFWRGLLLLPNLPDFWVWFYLAVAVSSTMLPSESDRRGWLPVLLALGFLLFLALLAGAGPWMLANIAPALNRALRSIAVVFGISLGLHLFLLLPLRLLRALVMRVTGLRLVEETPPRGRRSSTAG